MFTRSVVLVIALGGAAALSVFGQVDTGSILGTVTDQSGAVIPGAKVTLRNQGTAAVEKATTDKDGAYSFSPLKVGTYSVSVEQPGFARTTHSNVPVNIQQQTVINFTLQPGTVQQTVNVTSAAPVLQTQNASVGQVIQARQINDLPLNGRNYFFLAQLAAGVTFGQKGVRGEDKTGRFTANGTRPTQNDYLLGGMDNNSSIISRQNGKDFVVQTPIDALSEFKIQTNNYSAEFGRSAGAVINAVIKSGTNQFHGDAWEFIRNNAFDANDFFLNAAGESIPAFHRNQFGFTQGGPVILPKLYNGKNKTFFFADYEGTRISQGTTYTKTIPTLAEKNSGFTNFSDLITGQSGSFTDVLGRVFPAGTIFDPATTHAIGNGYVRSPFPGNVIPSSRIDPNAVKLLDLLPKPTGSGIFNNYVTAPPLVNNVNSFDIRIDENFGSKDRLFVRYSYNDHNRVYPGPFPGFADGGTSTLANLSDLSQNALIGETHIFGPRLVNELRVGLNREHALWVQPFANDLGIPEKFGIQGIVQRPLNGGLPRFDVGSISHFGSWGYIPSNKYGTTPQITDDLTLVRGANTMKVGFEGQRVIYPYTQPPQSRGFFVFSGAFTSVVGQTDSSTGIAQMLLAPTASSNLAGANRVTVSNVAPHNLIRNYWGAYFQDDWKATSKLTLDLGVRYDYYSIPHERLGHIANFLPGRSLSGGTYLVTPQIAAALPPDFTGALAAEGIAVKRGGREVGGKAQRLNFAPRFGFAYQVLSHLVIRGGYGIFYGGIEEIGGSPLLIGNFPIEYDLTRTSPSPVTPITADNSIGLLETSFKNFSLDPATVNPLGVRIIGRQYHWQTPYTQSENFMLEYQLGSSSSLTVGYVGSNSRHIETGIGLNPPLELLPPGTDRRNYVPYPTTALSGDNYTETSGSSNYSSLQTTFRWRFSHGLSLLADFTWQKTLSDARDPLEGDIGGYRAPWLPGFGIEKDFALANFDVPRVFHVSGTYQLPFGPGKEFGSSAHGISKTLISGWSLNWIATVQDGQPFTVGCARATSTGFGCNAFMVPGANLYANSSVAHFVNAAAFTNPPAVTTIGQTDYAPLGGAPTQAIGPPFRELDLSVFKNLPFGERVHAQFRAEIFNITNTPNFANPSNLNFDNVNNFGQITATRNSPNDPREIQLALKLYW